MCLESNVFTVSVSHHVATLAVHLSSCAVGVEAMMRADKPLVIPQNPSSAISCLNVPMMEVLPSTCSDEKQFHH